MGKADKNKEIKENALLKTAFEFFTTKGFSDTSVSDIAEKAGIAKGTFYLYFKDKYDIRDRLVEYEAERLFMSAIAETEKDLTFEDRIISIIDNIINQLNENKPLLNFMTKNLSSGVFRNTKNDGSMNFSEVYYSIFDGKMNEFADPEIMLFMIMELVSSACCSAILHNEPCSPDELKPHLYDTIRLIIGRYREKNK